MAIMYGKNRRVRVQVDEPGLAIGYVVIDVAHGADGSSTIAQGDAYSGHLQLLQSNSEDIMHQIVEDILDIDDRLGSDRALLAEREARRMEDVLEEEAIRKLQAEEDEAAQRREILS